MVKARLMGDDHDRWSLELQQMLRPFVYRRYIDFSVIQSLRNMKGMISREVRRRGLKNNIKLGAGGIRETEFIVQVFQLIRGGRERSLQLRSLLPTLEAIKTLALLPAEQVDALRVAYLFLRRLENLLQSLGDEQTQTLPEDELHRARLAWAMDCADWPALMTRLDGQMAAVRAIFDELIGEDTLRLAISVSWQSFRCCGRTSWRIANWRRWCRSSVTSSGLRCTRRWRRFVRISTGALSARVAVRRWTS